MNSQLESIQAQRDHAERVFVEMLTAVPPEVKEALIALQDLMKAEQQLLLGQGKLS